MFSKELYDVLILVGASLATFVVCQKLRLTVAVGYLLAGVLLGPSGAGLLSHTPFLSTLSHVGILLFLFSVGIEIPFHRLRALKRYIFGIGLAQTTVTAGILAAVFCRFLPFSELMILMLSLAFSSTAVVVQLLSERFEMTTQLGRTALAILLFQDIVAIGMFVYLGVAEASQAGAFNPLLMSSLGLVLSLGAGALMTKVTEKLLSLYRYSEFITAFVLLSVLGLSLMTEWFHLSSELGAFVVGMAMASTHWRHQISIEIHPFRTIFLAIFFISMGIEIDVWTSLPFLHYILLGVVGIVAYKGLILWICARVFRLQGGAQLGALMGGCSEFLFMILPIIKPTLGNDLTNALLLMGFLSMIVTPFIFLGLKKFSASTSSTTQASAQQYPIIVAGFGHVGQTIARILEHNFVPFLTIDYDTLAIKKAVQQNYTVMHGDARDIEFLKRIKIHEAKVFLITFGHLASSVELVRALRKKFPGLAICVQVKDYNQASRFAGLGAHLVVPEDIESGMHMASLGLQFLGFSQDYAQKMVHFPQTPIFLGARK